MAASYRAATAPASEPGFELPLADRAWRALLSLAARASDGAPIRDRTGVRWTDDQGLSLVAPAEADWIIDPGAPRGWRWPGASIPPGGDDARRAAAALLDLFVPLCVGADSSELVIGHLAQSLDGRIATRTGASQFISGEGDLVHTHRLRALCDAVVVGAETVLHDDPRLTTRLAPGPSPTRVILDPRRRLCANNRVFSDGAAPTLLLCSAAAGRSDGERHGQAEIVAVAGDGDAMAPEAMLAALRARGLSRIFVEGGGVTISRFLAAGAFHRLHIAIAPVILGSGRSSFTMAPIDELSAALRLDAHHVACGADVLLDCVPRR